MEEKFGLMEGMELRLVKTDPELIDVIVSNTGKPHAKIKSMMRYNMFTIQQFADLVQLDKTTIINKTRPSVIDRKTGTIGTELDYCFPRQAFESLGSKNIIRNEKAEKFFIKILEKHRKEQEESNKS